MNGKHGRGIFGLVTSLALCTGCYTGLQGVSDLDGSGSATGEDGEGVADGIGGVPDLLGPGVCTDTYQRFRDDVWTAFMATDCHGCHNPSGLAATTTFILHDASHPNYVTENLQTLRMSAANELDGIALPLLKMSEAVPHAGELRFGVDSPEYEALAGLVEELSDPVDCVGVDDYDSLVAQLELLDPLRTLRRATFALVGHPPSGAQEQRVADGGWDAFDEVLDEIMDEPAFPVRIGELYNDALLTDSFLIRGNNILYTIDASEYPGRDWFEETEDPNSGRAGSIRGLTKAPLALVEHVVREGLPFSEVLLADYTMVNPQSARVYGVDTSEFDDPQDAGEFRPASLPGIPHAGILTTLAFLNQYPNTDTNLNRHRARTTYRLFQSSDVLRLSLRPIDLATIDDEYPTMTNNACAVCHSYVDPVASAFQNWTNNGRYRAASEREEPWPDYIREAGFNGEVVSEGELGAALQWLAPQLVDNPRFSVAVVKTIFAGLLRQTPLLEPTDPSSETYYEEIIGVAFEDAVIKDIAEVFRASNYDMRVLVRELVRSPHYRAIGASPETTTEQRTILRNVGMAHPLRPTQLYARIEQKTGLVWRPDTLGSAPVLRLLELLFGEIDSLNTTSRLAEANGLFASFVARMSDQVVCRVVGSEYATPASERRLLPLVSFEDTPDTADGEEKVRANIRHLFDHLLDTRPAVDDSEVDVAYALFQTVREQGRADIEAEVASIQVSPACRASSTVDGVEIRPGID